MKFWHWVPAHYLQTARLGTALALALVSLSCEAVALRFSFTDPVGPDGDPAPKGQVDVTSVVVVFESTTGTYEITVSTDPSGPFFGSQRVNLNTFNPDTGSSEEDPAIFNRNPILDTATPTTSVVITGTNTRLMSWKAGDRVAANSDTFGNPNGPSGISSFRSQVIDWPVVPGELKGDYFGVEAGQYAVIELVPPDPVAVLQMLRVDVAEIGPGSSLADKVAIAQAYYAVPDVQATCATLTDFVSQVRAQANKKKLTTELGDELIANAQAIMEALGCN